MWRQTNQRAALTHVTYNLAVLDQFAMVISGLNNGSLYNCS